MTTKEIIKGNTLIAEFMKWGDYNTRRYDTPYDDAGWCNGEPTSYCNDDELKFHKIWDWLMPVIVKITDLPEFQEYKKVTGYEQINIYPKCIEDTWIEVVAFAEWYNSTHISSDIEQEDKHKQMTIFDIEGV